MSGYLDVKCPARVSRGLSLFKAWKKQWCILRPNPLVENSGVLALHSTVGLVANSTIDLPPGSTVCRTTSRTHQYAFGVFLSGGGYRKPYVLLAGQTESETQMWMAKIRALLNGKKQFDRNILLKNSYEVSIIDNEFSRKCLLYGVHGTLTISSHGLLISQPDPAQLKIFIAWKHFSDIVLAGSGNIPDKNKICQIVTNSSFSGGAGRLSVFSSCGAELVRAVKQGREDAGVAIRRLSRSEGDLYNWSYDSTVDGDAAGIRRSSWYSGPSEVSLDDTDLIRTKDTSALASGQLLRFPAADDLYPISCSKLRLLSYVHKFSRAYTDTPPDRRSCASLASGIYEEILEDIDTHKTTTDKHDLAQATAHSTPIDLSMELEENTYESVAECVYATMRRTGKRHPPPPLPPRAAHSTRVANSTTKLTEEWSSRLADTDEVDGNTTRHGSLGSLPRSYGVPEPHPDYTKTLPKFHKNRPFNVFRKRVKSDSRVTTLVSKPDKTAGEPKKKRFDFNVTPSKSIDIIKNFRVSRVLMRNLRISSRSLSKLGEARSCEYLDTDADVVDPVEPRCSKSAESLGGAAVTSPARDIASPDCDDGQDLSAIYSELSEQFSLPHDIVELILKGRDDLADLQLRRRQLSESDYIPMSPNGLAACAVSRPPCEEHYTVMTSPAPAPPAPPTAAPDIIT